MWLRTTSWELWSQCVSLSLQHVALGTEPGLCQLSCSSSSDWICARDLYTQRLERRPKRFQKSISTPALGPQWPGERDNKRQTHTPSAVRWDHNLLILSFPYFSTIILSFSFQNYPTVLLFLQNQRPRWHRAAYFCVIGQVTAWGITKHFRFIYGQRQMLDFQFLKSNDKNHMWVY